MRKLVYSILLATTLLNLSSCVMSSDKDYVQDPGFKLATIFYNIYLEPSFRAGEMTLFFDKYQDIRQDREASLSLMKQYFGDVYPHLYFEEAHVGSHGTIYLTQTPHSYLFKSSYLSQSLQMETSISKKYISINVSDSYDKCELSMNMNNNQLYIYNIKYESSVKNDSKMSITVIRPLRMTICSNGQYSLYPNDGLLKFVVTGSVEDSFEVEYNNDGFVLRR